MHSSDFLFYHSLVKTRYRRRFWLRSQSALQPAALSRRRFNPTSLSRARLHRATEANARTESDRARVP